ncbi:MAG: toxin TcdB middle/N-terminal domain-containing protein [Sulfurovum sp.]|nr:toxin TcdB middle/N-terminal domain-containing protein [Sulfurovum sp.]
MVDINGDGYVDIVDKSKKNGVPSPIWLNYPKTLFEAVTHDMPFTHNDDHYNALYGDFNGDGIIDIYETAKGLYLGNAKKEMITAVTDSFENTTEISYASLSDPDVYTKGHITADHVIDVQPAMQVVHTTEVSDGIGGKQVQHYTYGGFRYHTQRGSLGFETVQMNDETTGGKTIVTYRQEYPFIGVAKKTELYMQDELLNTSTASDTLYLMENGKRPVTNEEVPFPGTGCALQNRKGLRNLQSLYGWSTA